MNWQTILVVVLLCGVLSAIIIRGIQKRKSGKGTCGCGCADCALSGACHKK